MESDLTGPRLRGSEILFELADAEHNLEAAALYQEVKRPRLGPEMEAVEGGWATSLRRPPVDRLEYLFVVRHPGGHTEWVPDPANPMVADGPFGAKSVLELPGYVPPSWLALPEAPGGTMIPLRVVSRALRRTMDVQVWTSAGQQPDSALPLLVVNDGPEYARYVGLLDLLDKQVHRRELPPMHIALLQPGRRNSEYSANPAYARALAQELIPAIESAVRIPPTPRARAFMGTSLGGVAMMSAHLRHPDLCGGLFLQSSSFFRHRLTNTGAGFPHYSRVLRFVDQLLSREAEPGTPVPVVLTCGVVEENLKGNRAVADSLSGRGYPVRLVERRDAHNWIAWRDALEPHLTELLQELWA